MTAATVMSRPDAPATPAAGSACPSAVVRAVLAADDSALDYCHAKLAFDRLIDPTFSAADVLAQLDRMEQGARQLAGPGASGGALLVALRRVIYEPGPWNEDRPHAYDHDDPLGQRVAGKVLATYLATRRGNCVSMPALLLVLGERLGLDLALARAPLHMFLRYRRDDGQSFNIEATSGGHTARDEWYRSGMPMTDRAIASGVYMRALPKREGVALLATTVLEHLLGQGRLGEALAVSDAILRHAPTDAHVMAKQGTVCAELLRTEFEERYRVPALIPPALRGRYVALAQRNRAAFQAAEALGWEAVA